MAYSPSNHQDRRQTYYVGPSHAGEPTLDEEQRRSPSLPRGGVGRPQNDPHQLAPTVGPTYSRGSINRNTTGERMTFRRSPRKDGSDERPQAPFSRAQKGKAHMGGPSQQRFPQRATRDLPKKPVYGRIGRVPTQGRPRTYRSESSSSDEQIPSSEEDTDESSSSDGQSEDAYRRHKHVTPSDSSSQEERRTSPQFKNRQPRKASKRLVPKKKVQIIKTHYSRDPENPRLRTEVEELKTLMKQLLPR